ncbi:MAG: cytochrome P450 [Burkholderiaceae bacterium]
MEVEATSLPQHARSPRLREIDELPGPRGLPFVGTLFQIERSRLHQNVEAWSRDHGAYFRFRLGSRTLLGVADHEALATVLRDRPDGFRRSRHLQNIAAEMGLQPGVFAANGDAWRRQRRMVMAGFDPAHVRAYFPALLKVTQRLQRRWLTAARNGQAIELQPELMRFTVDAIAGLAFGADINTLESDDDVIQRHLDQVFPALFKRAFAMVPLWRWLRLPADRRLERSVAAINRAIEEFIEQARERLATNPVRRAQPPNLLEAMIVAADEPDSGITDAEVAGNVLTMLLAGEDTTANTLAWMIHLLASHPEALRRARDEVRRLAGDATALTPEQMGSLDYLEACAHETMRLKPVAPFQVIEALRYTTIADIRVPAGTAVWCVMRGDSISERHFPDPLRFDPERWLSDRNPGQAASAAKRVSMPFGAGPRVCPGRYLALLEIKMAMAMLLGQFDIERVDTPDGRAPRELMAFTMTPVGLRMRLREAP